MLLSYTQLPREVKPVRIFCNGKHSFQIRGKESAVFACKPMGAWYTGAKEENHHLSAPQPAGVPLPPEHIPRVEELKRYPSCQAAQRRRTCGSFGCCPLRGLWDRAGGRRLEMTPARRWPTTCVCYAPSHLWVSRREGKEYTTGQRTPRPGPGAPPRDGDGGDLLSTGRGDRGPSAGRKHIKERMLWKH